MNVAQPFTGERVVADEPGSAAQQSLYTIHQALYTWVAQYCHGRRVLDPGCGTGHGTNLITRYAREVWGADIAGDAVQFAARRYPALQQRCFVSDATRLGLPAHHFDVVIAIEIIEHLESDEAFLREVQRLLRPQGTCFISTPNRLVHSSGQRTPLNPFHVREYTYAELVPHLQRFFQQVTVFGVVIHNRDFLIRHHHSQGIHPVLPFPLGNIERFARWHIPCWQGSVVRPQQVEVVRDVPRLCWGFLAMCAAPRRDA
jgi:SAM-dependent methyltransferase